ncbi:MAG: hypothetical protein LQ350_004123 [Teloschistes chrysophthalmus]|nr:MAG: hypothetical protein LQ350_004123 [Niorma chrysophthalma]
MAVTKMEEQDLQRSISVTDHIAQTHRKAQMGDLVLHRLIDYDETDLLCPINHLYNYLPSSTRWLSPQPISLPTSIASALRRKCMKTSQGNPNSIRLRPFEAGLPVHTGLTQFRQCTHWKTSARAGEILLQLFARDPLCAEVNVGKGQSLASQALKQLTISPVDTYARFAIYMNPRADQERARLLGQSMVLIFVFDGSSFLASHVSDQLRDLFVARLNGTLPATTAHTPLQAEMTQLREKLLRCDEEEGNGGREILQHLIEFYHHSPPSAFTCVRDYLDYRYEDIANRFIWAGAKFSLNSSVDLDNYKYKTLLRHLGDHMSIANDIASYAKEKRSFEKGDAAAMINVVHVIAQKEGLGNEQAKCMAYAWQLWTENQISEEIKRLHDGSLLDLEEWAFVDACLLAASGNLLTSVVIPRYGGERIKRAEAS